jgi:nitroreductase
MTDFNQLLVDRRSIRDFLDKPVTTDIVKELIKETTLAPSSGNGQPWSFIIVNSKGLIKRLSDESKKNLLADIANNPASSSKRYEATLKMEAFNVFYNAPCLVIISGPVKLYSTYIDCALAAGYFMLAAANKGLGSCWVNLGSQIREEGLKKEIGLLDGHVIVAPIILGWPNGIPQAPERKEPQIVKVIEA